MKFEEFYLSSLIGATLFLGMGPVWGCGSTHETQQHPDEVDFVVRAFMTNGFGAVNVSQDRSKGAMTLTGTVQSEQRKRYAAAQIAHVNASDYVIADEITVTPPTATVAQLTEDRFKAILQAHPGLDRQDINYGAEKWNLHSIGECSYCSATGRSVKLAKGVPNVERVVDEIKVERQGD